MNEKVRFQMRIAPETDQRIKAAMPLANCRSQNEFVEKAILHYCSCLQAEDSSSVLAKALVDALSATVNLSEMRTNRLLFKLAVEMDLMMNVLASELDISDDLIDQLRGRCVRNVKSINGDISFKSAVRYQNGVDGV